MLGALIHTCDKNNNINTPLMTPKTTFTWPHLSWGPISQDMHEILTLGHYNHGISPEREECEYEGAGGINLPSMENKCLLKKTHRRNMMEAGGAWR